MTDAVDPWAAFPDAPAAPAAAAPAPVDGYGDDHPLTVTRAPQKRTSAASNGSDPWASFPDAPAQAVATAPINNVPTAKDDPIYHGAVPVQQAPDQGAVASFLTGVQGVPIVGPAIAHGVQDAAAALRSFTGGTSYDAEKQHVQDLVDVARQQHPVAAAAGDFTGGALATAPLAAAAPAAFGIPVRTAEQIAAGAPAALTAGNVGIGAATGSALGGADSAVRSNGDMNSAVQGAIAGALLGAAAPVVGYGLSRAGQAAGAALGRVVAPDPGVSRPVAQIIGRAAQADAVAPAQGAANIAAAGPDGMLVDAAPSLSSVLDTAMQRGGSGATGARQAIETRAANADQALTGALDEALGAPQGIQTTTDALRDSTAQARQAAYDAAYNSPIDYTSAPGRALEAIVNNRVPAGIIARANAQMRTDGTPSRQIIARIGRDGSVTYEQMPDVRQIDYMTRALNDVARSGDGQGALGGNTSEGRSYGNLARELRDTLRQAVPEYGRALETAAQPIQARNALEFGSQLLSPSLHRDVVVSRIAEMTAPELAHARQGLRSAIAETLANVKRTITDPNVDAREAMAAVKMLSSEAAQDKVRLLLGPAQQRSLGTALDQAMRALQLRASVTTNSRTFGRTVTNEAVKQAVEPGLLSKMLMSGGPMKATRPIFEMLTGNRPQDISAREDALYGELANVLTQPRGHEATGLLNQILGSRATEGRFNTFAGNVPYGALSSAALLSLVPIINERAK